MIRPWTAITCVLAGVAVLYTYQSKHSVQLLDRQIEKTLAETTGLREQSRALRAEWTLRENPERLRAFSDQYLSLRPMLPEQFTTLADLDSRLPAPRAWVPTTGTTDTTEDPADVSVAAAQPTADTPAPAPDETAVAEEALPIPPLPVAAPPFMMATNAALIVPKPASPRPPVAASAVAPTPPNQAARTPPPPMPQQPPRVVATAAPPLQARQQQAPVPMQQPAVQTGSLLAVGRGSSFAPVPRPIPVSTNQWNNGY
jgi:hypothetical protein